MEMTTNKMKTRMEKRNNERMMMSMMMSMRVTGRTTGITLVTGNVGEMDGEIGMAGTAMIGVKTKMMRSQIQIKTNANTLSVREKRSVKTTGASIASRDFAVFT